MTIALDASMLILLFDEEARGPNDPFTGQPVTHCQDRISHFVNTFSLLKGARIVIPTPALSEFLVKTKPGSAPEYLNKLQRIPGFHLIPFSVRAAIELSEMQRSILQERGRGKRTDLESRAKAKFDQQIVAIAKVEGASVIYSDDERLGKFAARFGIERIGIAQLPISPQSAQGTLALKPPGSAPDSASKGV